MSLSNLVPVQLPFDLTSIATGVQKQAEKPAIDFMAVLQGALDSNSETSQAPQSTSTNAQAEPERTGDSRPDEDKFFQTYLMGNEAQSAQGTAEIQTAQAPQPWHQPSTNSPTDRHIEQAKLANIVAKSSQLDRVRSMDLPPKQDLVRTGPRDLPREPDRKGHLPQILPPAHPTETKPGSHVPSGGFDHPLKSLTPDSQSAVGTTIVSKPNIFNLKAEIKKTDKTVAAKDVPGMAGKKSVPRGAGQDVSVVQHAQIAATKMQLHADSTGGKGIQEALQVVHDLARNLNIKSDATQFANQNLNISPVIQLVRLGQLGVASQKQAAPSRIEVAEKSSDPRQNRLEMAKKAATHVKDAFDSGRIQLSTLPGQNAKPSLVLETMTAASRGNSQTAGKGEENSRKESIQLVNSAYYTPGTIGNSVSIPVHLVADQQGNLRQAMKNYLDKGGNEQIVQYAKIVMNGTDSGEIRLVLKPEHLGEVRINLQMQDGHIAGEIFVENKDVQQVFQDNLQSLAQAFSDGGLTPGDLTVAVRDRGAGGQRNQNQGNSQDSETSRRRTTDAVRALEGSVANARSIHESYNRVNLVV